MIVTATATAVRTSPTQITVTLEDGTELVRNGKATAKYTHAIVTKMHYRKTWSASFASSEARATKEANVNPEDHQTMVVAIQG